MGGNGWGWDRAHPRQGNRLRKRKEALRDKVPSKAKPGPRLLSGMLFPLKWQRNQGKISTSVCVCLRIWQECVNHSLSFNMPSDDRNAWNTCSNHIKAMDGWSTSWIPNSQCLGMLGSAIALVSLLLTLSVSASPVAPVVHGGDLTYNNGLKDVSHSKLDARSMLPCYHSM